MLAQPITFEDELPVNITLADITEYPIHYHGEIELIFILSGSLQLRNGSDRYTMHEGEVFISNPNELHAYYKTDEPNISLILQIDNEYFSKFYPELANAFFVPDPDDPDSAEMMAMREILCRIIMESLDGGEGYEFRIIEQMHSLISLLMESFQNFRMENGHFVNNAGSKSNPILAERMGRIQDYLYDNYSRKLTLQEIADREHLSVYYLSHVIKSSTGMSFKDFLSFVRVEESERLLIGTDKKITAISEAVGFSAVRYYIKYFERWYGVTPQEYRKSRMDAPDIAGTVNIQICNKDQVRSQIKRISNTVYRAYTVVPRSPSYVITADLNEPADKTDMAETMLGSLFGEKREGKRADAFLFDLLTGLGETVVGSGHDYIITSDHNDKGDKSGKGCKSDQEQIRPERAAVLIYNTGARDNGVLLKEFLVKLNGFSGSYFVRRIRYSAANIKAASEEIRLSKVTPGKRDGRKMLYSRIDSFPSVTDTIMTAAGILTFEIPMEDYSGELILIDKQ
jgi:AraC-like DNA-binding protein